MGHSGTSSLRHYLTDVLNERLQTSAVTTAAELEAQIRQLELSIIELMRVFDPLDGLSQVAENIRNGKLRKAAKLMRQHADKLSN